MAATPAPAAPPAAPSTATAAAAAKAPANPMSAEEKALLRGLDKLRSENKLTDVTLIVEEHRFKAHRVVLAASSDYFCAMFADCAMIESRKDEINLYGITARALGAILDFIYTSTLELNYDNIEEILAAATHVQVREVIERCTLFLGTKIEMENCLAIAGMADIYGIMDLSERAHRYICAHFEEFATTSDFREMKVDQLRFILASNYPIDVAEQDLVRLVCSYALEQQLEEAELGDLLRLIKWPHISYSALEELRHANCALDEGEQLPLPTAYYNRLEQAYMGGMLNGAGSVSPEDRSLSQGPKNMRGMELCLLKIGGFEWKGLTNVIMCFSPTKMSWYELTAIPHIDQCNFGTAVLNNKLFIVGGAYDVCLKEYIHPFGFCYCPLRNTWMTIAPIQLDRCRFSLNAVGNRHLYAVGGILDDDNPEEALRTISNVERYDIEQNVWTYMPSLQEHRSQHAGVVVGDKLYISGGIHLANILASMWVFDTKTELWQELAPMPTPCCDHVLVAVDSRIYACGGWHESLTESRVLVQHIYAYDIEANAWSVETQIPAPKFYSGVTAMGRTIFFVGGLDSTESIDRASAETMAYDLDSKEWWREKDSWDSPNDVWESTCAAIYVPMCDF
ncbi:kelch-like protein 26 isoform X1 [Drosophila biarmipes]|uniref:kelch-like protein 26 isoform X1 n=2 Tax=Drosophila biarmipes TaxID=125945 RepID=UPI0007E83D36|nr:kelch-like protein 26 isoform X1 [Drosophila biarmipes]